MYTKIQYLFTFIIISCLLYLNWTKYKEYKEYKKSIEESANNDEPMLFTLKSLVREVHPDIDNLEIYKGHKSYIIDKKKIYLCLKDKNGEYYDINHLIYVLLHEFAHYLNKDEVGHTKNFHTIFDSLLEKAELLGIYDANIPMISDYCNF